ncbi:beta-aspartyl-peptidase [Neptunicella sp.]|uniref:beta-aspartyl-peptidase n=1 Tax=Neptunicella sp. TaxID=2125986 RepID=UPI003F68CF95
MNQLILIEQIEVYAPEYLGTQDVLICGNQIAAIEPELSIETPMLTRINGRGKLLFPGLVDSLVHISGGGGEGGFHTRTPQMTLTDATAAGVTTVIGALGTDSVTRTLPDLLAKAHGLENEGLSVYCYSGSYQVPVKTITGSVEQDIIFIDKMIGVGEVAIADHRSSQPTIHELARIASQARVAGMLSGKKGIVSIHVGEGESQLTMLQQVIEQTDIPAHQFYPTHINRNQSLLDAGISWCKQGGVIDFTTSTNEQYLAEGEIPAALALAKALQAGVDIAQLTMSSDGNASLPVFDSEGHLTGLEVGKVASLYEAVKQAVTQYNVSLSDALSAATLSPANILGLTQKGRVCPGTDADLLIVNASNLNIESVYGKGKLLVEQGMPVCKGTFD